MGYKHTTHTRLDSAETRRESEDTFRIQLAVAKSDTDYSGSSGYHIRAHKKGLLYVHNHIEFYEMPAAAETELSTPPRIQLGLRAFIPISKV
jgi:hypothetical protein